MNPLKYRLPELTQTDASTLQPQPAALSAWIDAQPIINAQSTAPLLLTLLQNYNRCELPTAMRFKAAITLQPVVDGVVKQLRNYYQNESLPLLKSSRKQANLVTQILDEAAIAYKRVVSDSVTVDQQMSINLVVAALRLSIDQIGQQLLESYSQYAMPAPGLWGELNRTYQLAERNGLHTRVLTENAGTENPFATVQHGYLRVALLALTMPNHLMPGQAKLIYGYLEKWTAGCRILNKKVTEAKIGDIFIDLAGERPPAVSTGHARFRPIDGRFLDISKLQEKLDDVSASVKSDTGLPLTIAERMRRDLLTRLRAAWQGRAERSNQRESDMNSTISLCIGLDACHHFIDGENSFTPEQGEIRNHRPQEAGGGLELIPTKDAWGLEAPSSSHQLGLDDTRLSRFSEKVDVWDAVHSTEIQARDKREAAMASFRVEPWLCINQSAGGMALRRQPEILSRTRVGALVAVPTDEKHTHWKIGALRWLQDNSDSPDNKFDIGVMIITDAAAPVAVRAIGGAGTGGEYFRSLLIENPKNDVKEDTIETNTTSLLVPASIYDIDTQLVLNRQTTLEYVRLTRLIETTSSFSMFEFKHIEVPPAEQAKISAIRQQQ